MIKLLIRKFIKNYENVENNTVREKYAVLGGVLGIVCNLFLFGLKLTIGLLMNSIAITSDAFHNLSDTGASVVAIVGSKMSNRMPDKEHPFGHGRVEYISALVVAFIIMMFGLELIQSSYEKIKHYEAISFNMMLVIILSFSVLVNVWIFYCSHHLGKAINSGVLLATAFDSLNDVIATIVIIISTLVSRYIRFPLDGIMGIGVSLLVIRTGFSIAKETISSLLGTPPSKDLVDKITARILSGDGIVGMHDLIVHEYGPGRVMASVHAEVPDTIEITKIHEVIDEMEQYIMQDLGIHIVIHMDPISVSCERTEQTKKLVREIIVGIDNRLSIHDFRMTDGENRINLIFDLAVPYTMSQYERDRITALITEKLENTDSRYHAVIQVDNAY